MITVKMNMTFDKRCDLDLFDSSAVEGYPGGTPRFSD
jgi:hypothetical protein